MPKLELRAFRPGDLSHRDMHLLRKAQQLLEGVAPRATNAAISVADDCGEPLIVDVPLAILGQLMQLLQALGTGRSLILAEVRREITTAEAASLLKVSRPFIVKQMESGKLPYRMVGAHRRLALDDVLEYVNEKRLDLLRS